MPSMENPTARETNAGGSLSIPGPGGAVRRLWSVYGGYALGFVSLFLIWQLASRYVVSSVLFPPPTVVFSKGLLLVRNGVLLEHLAASMQRILAGFIAGSLLGIPIGLAMGSFWPVRKLLEPYTEFLRFIPSVSLVTLGLLGFAVDRMFRWSIYTFAGKYSPAT